MKFLTANTLAFNGQARIGAQIQLTKGEPFYLANDYSHVRDAVSDGEPFEAHKVVGMKPVPITINPKFVVSVDATS